jgi:carbon storage regulator
MLILTRRIGETIIIGDNVKLTILRIDARNNVAIGFDAPKDIPINREEIFKKIQEQHKLKIEAGGKTNNEKL